ncbi:MAG: hypothetical protein VB099_20055 [Candidatus Limiplasma sp.]|nr:hypothetical protein [Candidatus Limiplasma sp.]
MGCADQGAEKGRVGNGEGLWESKIVLGLFPVRLLEKETLPAGFFLCYQEKAHLPGFLWRRCFLEK